MSKLKNIYYKYHIISLEFFYLYDMIVLRMCHGNQIIQNTVLESTRKPS